MSKKTNNKSLKRLLIAVALVGIVICMILVLPLTDDNPEMPVMKNKIPQPPPVVPPPARAQPGTAYNLDPPSIGTVTPRIIKKVEPVYPEIALKAKIEGKVQIVVITDIYGRVKQASVYKGHPLLNQAALDAVKQWVYEPYILNGVPKPMKFMVVIKFRLKSNPEK